LWTDETASYFIGTRPEWELYPSHKPSIKIGKRNGLALKKRTKINVLFSNGGTFCLRKKTHFFTCEANAANYDFLGENIGCMKIFIIILWDV
jgi:hypothetical protein